MDPIQLISRPEVCPECGAAFSGEGIYCWLCGWKLGDPVIAVRKGPPKVNPYASPAPNPADLKWTFSLSTLFLWTALVAVVMGVVRIAPGLGIAFGILSVASAAHATAVVAKRKRRHGLTLTVLEKIEEFFFSLALVIGIASGSLIAAFGAFFVTCTAGFLGGSGFGGGSDKYEDYVPLISIIVAGAVFIGLLAYFLIRNVRRSKD